MNGPAAHGATLARGRSAATGAVVPRLSLREVNWDDTDLAYLCAEQQAELERLYGIPDIEPDLTASEMMYCLVGYVEDDPVTCGVLRRREEAGASVGEIKRMYTDPRSRSRGYGRAVLTELLDAARSAGLTRVELETGIRQPHAIAMYERAGFVPIANFGPYAEHGESRCFALDL